MPTNDASQAAILRALLSVAQQTGGVTLEEVELREHLPWIKGFKLTLNTSVILDGQHARAIESYCE